MPDITFNQPSLPLVALENVIPDYGAIIRRLKKMRLNFEKKAQCDGVEWDKSYVWRMIRNQHRIRRQRMLEETALSYWLGRLDIDQEVIANYEEAAEKKRLEDKKHLEEIDDNLEKISFLKALPANLSGIDYRIET